jgi:hypothetical protein
MLSRDEFPVSVKRILSARTANRCSNPLCRAATSGPKLDEDGSINIGVAAHITAAAVGGPRYDSGITSDRRCGAENGIWLCQNCAKLVDSDVNRFTEGILSEWKEQAESIASKEIGQAIKTPLLSNRANEIARNLNLRDTLRKTLLKPIPQRKPGEIYHPYEQFQSRIIIRSLEDSDYPKVSDSLGISGWFRVNPYDFYHDGIKVILRGGGYAIINAKGEWRPIDYYESFDECIFTRIKVWMLGCIPYRFISAYDLDGDEYYNEPHLFCSFANNSEPYEAIHYRTVGGNADYDWPLDEEHRLPEAPTV